MARPRSGMSMRSLIGADPAVAATLRRIASASANCLMKSPCGGVLDAVSNPVERTPQCLIKKWTGARKAVVVGFDRVELAHGRVATEQLARCRRVEVVVARG